MTDPQARLDELAHQVAADPGGPRYPALADALIAVGRYDEAVGVCQLGLADTPRADGYRSLAEALLLLNRTDEAFDAVEQALAGAHQDPRSLRLLGACHLAMGRPNLAQPVLEQSARLNPSDMVTLDLLTRTAIQASGGGVGAPGAPPASAPPAPGPAPVPDASAPWDDGAQASSFRTTCSEDAPGALALDLGGPPTGAESPGAGGAEDLEPLELDLGDAPQAAPPGPGDPGSLFGQAPNPPNPAIPVVPRRASARDRRWAPRRPASTRPPPRAPRPRRRPPLPVPPRQAPDPRQGVPPPGPVRRPPPRPGARPTPPASASSSSAEAPPPGSWSW